MTREERMESYIKQAQESAAMFVAMIQSRCPEMLSNEDRAYMFSDLKNSIGLWFDNALEDAKEADRAVFDDYRENMDRDRARGFA